MEEKRLKIVSLGGFGNVTQNLFVYEYQGEILVVDCGIGFINKINGETELVVPDMSYLERRKNQIKGVVLTHGHDDHIAGLPYLLKETGPVYPIYASRWTAVMAGEKLEEEGIKANINIIDSQSQVSIGPFVLSFIHVTHSIPDTLMLIIKTPVGMVAHAADFKFDWTPVMDRPTEVGKIALVGQAGIDILLSDCLRSEKEGYTLSEQMVEISLEREINDCRGKFFITTMSSNVSRWQQAINVIDRYGRKIVLVGRSVKHIIYTAADLGYLNIPKKMIVPLRKIKNYRPEQLAFLVAGSQAQIGSALDKIAAGGFSEIEITEGDKIVFSADYIPGNEVAIHRLIDQLSRRGADVSYSDIFDDLHVSGHGAQADLALMIGLCQAKKLLPIGGEFRHMVQYEKLAMRMGYRQSDIILPVENQSVFLTPAGSVYLGQPLPLNPLKIQQ